jgi:hypothetical protein
VTPLDHVVRIGRLLDSLGVPWVLGGSLASSIVGEPRSTMDIDVAVALDPAVVGDLIAAVAEEYYVSEDMVRDAVARHSSFNLIHFATGMKVDVFPLSDDPLDVRQLERRERVDVAPGVAIWVGAPDDQVLRKLCWFRLGGEVSERQWRDVVSILLVQGSRVDHQQLLADSGPLGVADLVERALADVAIAMQGGETGNGPAGFVRRAP